MTTEPRPASAPRRPLEAWITWNDKTCTAVLLSTGLSAFVLALWNPSVAPTSGNDCTLKVRFQTAQLSAHGRVAWFNESTGTVKIAISPDCLPETAEFINELHAILSTARGQGGG